ncbi:MAG: alpha/beta hydrolase [Marinibacterium sp.]|nr:alpha/beta hydrolase [Marinibacterium sp.]
MATRRAPGTISAEAAAVLAEAAAQPPRDWSKPVTQMRAESRATYAPACEAVVRDLGVALSEQDIGGQPCMVIDPPMVLGNRRMVYLFGGGFTLGSPFEDLPISATLAVQTNAQVIAPYYPLAPEHPYPAALNACTDVLRAVLAETPGACLAGESAGGNLALAATLRLRQADDPVPRALALLSPATDMGGFGDSADADRDPFIAIADSEFFHRAYLPEGADLTDPGLSPIWGSFDADFPPVFTTTGTRDLLMSGCVRLDRVLREAGVDSTLRIWEGMWHVFEFYPNVPEAAASLSEIAGFLNDRFA